MLSDTKTIQVKELTTLEQELIMLQSRISELEQSYNELYDFNPTSIITIDTNYIIKNLNFRGAILFSEEKKGLSGKSFLNCINTNSKQLFQEKIEILVRDRLNQTFNINLKNQNRQLIRATITCRISKTNLIHLSIYDISHITHGIFNPEIHQSFLLIDRLFEGTDEALAALDITLNIKIMNESFSYLFSKIITKKITLGMNIIHSLKAFPELQSKIEEAFAKALKGEKVYEIIENSFANIKDYYCFELNISSLEDLFLLRIKNITNFKIEEKLKHQWQAEIGLSCRASVKDEMASALAHEINQPLAAIANYSQACLFLIQEETVINTSQLIEPIKNIATQVELAGNIIHNMRNLSHPSVLNREKININELIKATLSLLQYELLDFKIKITLNLQEELPLTLVNKIHIMQVLLNLSRNSIEAFKSNNDIQPELTFETKLERKNIIVHVRDNGPGIPQEYLNKILNTYFTTKTHGTGVGLALCKTLIEHHGGELNVHSDTENGAWFSFSLPIVESK